MIFLELLNAQALNIGNSSNSRWSFGNPTRRRTIHSLCSNRPALPMQESIFQQLTNRPADILTYHVVLGGSFSAVTECMSADSVNGNPLSFTVDGGVMVNGANVTLPDVNTSNGVIHVIDKVLLPTATPNDIPRTAQCTGIHNTLVTAVIQAGLLETLQGEGQFTVFAPTDQAFTDAGIDLSTLNQSQLSDILLYHVLDSSVQSSTITDGLEITMVNGDNATFSTTSGVMINVLM